MAFLKSMVVASGIVAVCAGCTVMPSHGPASASVGAGAMTQVGSTQADAAEGVAGVAQNYVLVHVNNAILAKMKTSGDPRFAGMLTDRRAPQGLRIGAGDVISLSIFEAAPGGLFTPAVTAGARPGNFVDLPAQTVGRDGTINVPYAGTIPVANRTPGEIERLIEGRLRNRAIEPQVVLTLRDQRSSQVSVLGEVNTPAKFTINPQGERLLDAIARAGGPRYPAYETLVAVQRGGKKAQVGMSTLIRDPSNNIYIQPNDVVYVTREQRHFVALGASGQNGLFFFDSERVTLSYAMGKAGGLLDERAEPGAVFIYRVEPRSQLLQYGADLSNSTDQMIPTVYAINLRDPSGFFIAQNLGLSNRDVIFVGNSITVDVSKFLQFVRLGINTGREGIALGKAM